MERLHAQEVGAGRQPAFVKDSADDNAVSGRFIEDDVPALLKATETGGNQIAGTPQTRRISQQLEAPCELLNVAFGLLFSPGVDCVIEYFRKIGGTFWA
jgi:hypothetical protein